MTVKDTAVAQKGKSVAWRRFLEEWNVKLESLCGVTVALAQVPEAVAFALVAGLSPAVGVNSAWIIGLITAIAGGRPAMICGATGALAVVVPDLVNNHGIEYLFYAVILMGILQIILAALRAGSLIKMIPAPVMIGFCNGLALVIGLAQFNSYKEQQDAQSRLLSGLPKGRRLGGSFSAFTDGVPFISGSELGYSIGITVLAFVTCVGLPRLTKRVPSALMAIILSCVVEWALLRAAFNSGTKTVADASGGGIGGSFPIPVWFDIQYNMPPLSGETLKTIFPVSVVLAAIGLLESLMTLNLIDEITQTKGQPMRECFAQGVANVICGILGGMGGCAMIGQSMINIGSGARNRISSICAGLFLLIIVLVASPGINRIPVSALAGVMFNVVYHTFEWDSLKLMMISFMPYRVRSRLFSEETAAGKIRRCDAFVILLVTVVTLFTDLAVAVGCGTVFSCLVFAWECTEMLSVTTSEEPDPHSDGKEMVKVYAVQGILFFGSTMHFRSLFDPENDPAKVYIEFTQGDIADFSALEALNALAERYGKLGKSVTIRKLKPGCMKILRKANSLIAKELELKIDFEEKLPPTQMYHHNIETFQQGELMGHDEADIHGLTEKQAGMDTLRKRTGKATDDADEESLKVTL